jgi:hypothetical protein
MKTYLVTASYLTYCRAFIEAEDEEQACDIAHEMGGDGFKQEGFGDWEIDQITEMKEAQHG